MKRLYRYKYTENEKTFDDAIHMSMQMIKKTMSSIFDIHKMFLGRGGQGKLFIFQSSADTNSK